MTEQPKDYPVDERYQTARHVVSKLTPAEKGWLLAVVILFALMLSAGLFALMTVAEMELAKDKHTVEYIMQRETHIHELLLEITKQRADDLRRSEQLVENCVNSLSRQYDRRGRALIESAE